MDDHSELVSRLDGLGHRVDGLDHRVDALDASVRQLGQDVCGLRTDVGALRTDMGSLELRLVDRINEVEVRMERGFGVLRADVIKWSFAFWVGQVVALAAILRAMLP